MNNKKILSSHKLRVPMRVRLYKSGKLVGSKTLRVKSRVRDWVAANPNWDRGTIRVTYNKANDFWNEGEFTSYEQFDNLLSVFTELDLVKTFVNAS